LVPPFPPARDTVRGPGQAVAGYPNFTIDVGEFRDVVRHGQRNLGIGFDGNIRLPRLGQLQVSFDSTFADNALATSEGRISVDEYETSWKFVRDRGGTAQPPSLNVGGIIVNLNLTGQILTPVFTGGRTVPPDTPLDQQVKANDVATGMGGGIQTLISSINTVYGIRGFEEHAYHVADFPSDFEFLLLDDRALAMTTAFPYNRILEDRTSDWLERLVGVRIKFEFIGQRRVVIRAEQTKKQGDTLIVNEGLGLHQLLFMLLPIAVTPTEGTVLIEEPEAHLHPEQQASLANLLLRIAIEDKKQLVMATHSEHILMGFLAAIRQGKLSKDQLALYHVSLDEKRISHAVPLRFDETGRIQGGIPGFFEQNTRELLELLDSRGSSA